MTPGVFLCAAAPEDIAALVDLDARCSPHPWTSDHFAGSLRDREHTLALALKRALTGHPERIVGHCVVQVVADEAHIQALAVDPEIQRRGLGRWLLSQTLALAQKRGARRALLEVREGNRAAQGLYRSAGFVPAGRRRQYYSQPGEDALLFELKMPSGEVSLDVRLTAARAR